MRVTTKPYFAARKDWRPELDFAVDDVRPFGRFGGGLFTAHPIGFIVAAALVFTAWRLPQARTFTMYSVPCGVLVGLILWLFHRKSEFPSAPSIARKSS